MDQEYNNIEKMLGRELRNYSESAPDGVWDNIEAQLNINKKINIIIMYSHINFFLIKKLI